MLKCYCDFGIFIHGMFTLNVKSIQPRKSSTLPLSLDVLADCATCLKNRPRPLKLCTSFSVLAASNTETSSS